jgi:hypothetical protein
MSKEKRCNMPAPQRNRFEKLGETQTELLEAIARSAKDSKEAPSATTALEYAQAARALAEAFAFCRK